MKKQKEEYHMKMLPLGLLTILAPVVLVALDLGAKVEKVDCARIAASPRNSLEEMETLYRKFLVFCHPDRRGADIMPRQAHEEYTRGKNAYDLLIKEKKENKGEKNITSHRSDPVRGVSTYDIFKLGLISILSYLRQAAQEGVKTDRSS